MKTASNNAVAGSKNLQYLVMQTLGQNNTENIDNYEFYDDFAQQHTNLADFLKYEDPESKYIEDWKKYREKKRKATEELNRLKQKQQEQKEKQKQESLSSSNTILGFGQFN